MKTLRDNSKNIGALFGEYGMMGYLGKWMNRKKLLSMFLIFTPSVGEKHFLG
jgi:hypothetical protein